MLRMRSWRRHIDTRRSFMTITEARVCWSSMKYASEGNYMGKDKWARLTSAAIDERRLGQRALHESTMHLNQSGHAYTFTGLSRPR